VIDTRIEIRSDLCSEKMLVVGDGGQIRNALLNLSFNACDAMPRGGWLGFAGEVLEVGREFAAAHSSESGSGRYIRISVIDTGKGMSKEMRSKVFEPFFTTKTVGNEVGMGLSGVHGCAKRHRGFVVIDSKENVGTRFDLYFPCLSAPPE
jgi:signal transduction histidine kinase